MVQRFDDPVLTADERAFLRGAAEPLARARGTLEKLAAIGIDVTDDLAQLDAQEQIRAGLLANFTARRPRRVSGSG